MVLCPQALLPQLHAPHALEDGQVADGLKLMAWGCFTKSSWRTA